MKSNQNLAFFEKVTRRLANVFEEIHELCLAELKKAETVPPVEQQIAVAQVHPAIQIEIDSPEEPEKESKTKKIKKEGEDRQCEENKSKKKGKKITNKPKAPASSFLMFFKQQQANISKAYPNLGVTQLTKVAAKCWNELSTQQKEPYIRHCEQERKIYQQKMEKYRIDFPHEIAEKEKEREREREKEKEKGGRRQPRKDKKNVKQTPKKEKGVQVVQEMNEQPNGQFLVVEEEGLESINQYDDDSLGIV